MERRRQFRARRVSLSTAWRGSSDGPPQSMLVGAGDPVLVRARSVNSRVRPGRRSSEASPNGNLANSPVLFGQARRRSAIFGGGIVGIESVCFVVRTRYEIHGVVPPLALRAIARAWPGPGLVERLWSARCAAQPRFFWSAQNMTGPGDFRKRSVVHSSRPPISGNVLANADPASSVICGRHRLSPGEPNKKRCRHPKIGLEERTEP